jgi:hypothetical protein
MSGPHAPDIVPRPVAASSGPWMARRIDVEAARDLEGWVLQGSRHPRRVWHGQTNPVATFAAHLLPRSRRLVPPRRAGPERSRPHRARLHVRGWGGSPG